MKLVSYILIQLAPGTTKTAVEAISKIKAVKMAHAVTGPFDVVAFVEVPDLTTLSDLILAKIQNIEGVLKTQTAIVVSQDMLRPISSRTSQAKKSPGSSQNPLRKKARLDGLGLVWSVFHRIGL